MWYDDMALISREALGTDIGAYMLACAGNRRAVPDFSFNPGLTIAYGSDNAAFRIFENSDVCL